MSGVKTMRKIEVEQRDIDGATNCASNSPVARAVKRVKPGADVFVWQGCLEVDRRIYRLPFEADKHESWFTKTGQMEPFTFEFDTANYQTVEEWAESWEAPPLPRKARNPELADA